MTTNRFHTEEEATGFVQWADNLVAERDLARAEAASWEEQCLDARRIIGALRAELGAMRTEERRHMLPAGFDSMYDGRGSQ